MAKVKRKQIEYEGSITQFIKGDGSLGNTDDIKDALLLEYDMYTRVMSGATPEEIYAANNNKKAVIAVLKTEDQYIKTIGTYVLVRANHAVYSSSREIYIFHFLMIRPTTSGPIPFGYIYFDGSEWFSYSGYLQRQLVSSGQYQNIKTINGQSLLGTGDLTITFQDTNTQYLLDIETQDQTIFGATLKKYVIKLKDKDTEEVVSSVTIPIWGTRTINGENIIQKAHAAGDINLHDGYYFPNAVQDNDGNWYGAVVIGNQVWLGENYRSKTFRDGTAIQHYEQGLDPSIPWYYDGPESEDELKKHGRSYNWAAISKTTTGSNSELIQQLTIDGWHIPTDDDFVKLFNYTEDQSRYNSLGLETNMHIFASVEEWAVNNASPFGPVQIAKLNATGFSAYPTVGTSYCRFMTSTASDGDYVCYLCNLEDSDNKQFHKVSWASAPTQMWVRLLCDKTPAEFRAWYVAQYGSMQHILSDNELEVVIIEKVDNDYVCNKKDVDFFNMLKKGKQPIFYYKESDDSPYITQKGPLVCGENNYFCIFTYDNDEYLALYFELHILCAENKIETFVLEYEDIPDNNEIPVYHLVKTTTYKEIDGEKIVDLNTTSPIPFYTHDGEYYPNAIQDADGNWYGAVIVGNQVWLGENLKTTKFADGTAITNGGTGYSDSVAQYYEIVATNHIKNEGLRYNWTAIMNGASSSNSKPSNVQGVAPTGCHIPSAAEWQELLDYVGDKTELYENTRLGTSVSKALSSQLATHGRHNYPANIPGDEPEKNNYTMFTAMPTGMGGAPSSDNQQPLSFYGGCYFASCTESSNTPSTYMQVCFYDINSSVDDFNIADNLKVKGWAVRCLVDKTPYQFRAWYYETYGTMQHHLPQEIPTIPTPFFYGYTNTVESTPTKVVTLAEPTTGFKNGTYIMVYFAGGGVPAGNDNAISVGNDVYYLAYKAQGITQAGVINQGDKVLLWCHNGFAHVISNDRWSLPTVTAADEGKILKVVNGALALVNP